MNKKITQLASLVLAALFLAACGNKGDLFLPEKPDTKVTETVTAPVQQNSTEPEKK